MICSFAVSPGFGRTLHSRRSSVQGFDQIEAYATFALLFHAFFACWEWSDKLILDYRSCRNGYPCTATLPTC